MWRKARVLLIAGLAFLISGPVLGTAQEEVLHRISVDTETISIQVTSTGCTSAEDFRFLLKGKKRSVIRVTVIRIEPDTCEAAPQKVTLHFSRQDIGLGNVSDIVVTNSFRAFSIFGL
jgi:hypothetical protein